MRKSFWGLGLGPEPTPAPSKHPYRHAAIAHGVLALVILVLGWSTSPRLARTALMAAGYFVLATGWTWWRFRQQERSSE